MNTATQNLENDHVHILMLTDVMEQLTQSADPDINHIEKIIEIIKNFADGLHHAKEEDLFFPFLAGKGFSTSQGPVAVMLHEHEQGRNFVRGIEENVALYKKGNKNVVEEIYRNMMGYADLLRNHISKENNILFRMADRVLSDSEQLHLSDLFKETEKKHTNGSDDYITRINDLASIYISK